MGEGNGEAIYEIGVEDGGVPAGWRATKNILMLAGLSEEDMAKSLETLKRMAEEIHADVTLLRSREGVNGKVKYPVPCH